MKPADILEKIVSENGSCDWADPNTVCSNCPFSKLKQRPDGTYLSCLDALGVTNYKSRTAQDELYLKAAKEYLISQNIDTLLEK